MSRSIASPEPLAELAAALWFGDTAADGAGGPRAIKSTRPWASLAASEQQSLLRGFAELENWSPDAAAELVRSDADTFPDAAPAGVGALLRAVTVAAHGLGTAPLLPADLRAREVAARAALVPCTPATLLAVDRWWHGRSRER